MKKLLVGILALLFSFAVFAGTTDLDRLLLHERYGEDPWLGFGEMNDTSGVFTLEYDDADADAVCLLLDLPAGGTDVPVFLLASTSSDYGYFTNVTVPTFAIEDDAGGSYVKLDWTDSNDARLATGGSDVRLDINSPLLGFGYDLSAELLLAVTDTTGVAAMTQTGSAPTMSWTVPAYTFTNSTSMTTYTPLWVMGYDAGAAMTIAIANGTGNVTITQTGSNTSMAWTAAGGFTFTGDFEVVGSTTLDDLTLSGDFTVDDDFIVDVDGDITVTPTGGDVNATANYNITGDINIEGDITQTGSTTISVDLAVDGTTNLDNTDIDGTFALDGTTAVLTCSTSILNYTPIFTFGYDANAAMTFTTTETSGAIDITHTGNAIAVTWAATALTFTGIFEVNGASTFDGMTISGVITHANDYNITGDITQTGSTTISVDLDVDGQTNLDDVDIDGTVQIDGTVTVGVDGTSFDVTFYSDTEGDSMVWSNSSELLTVTGTHGAAALTVADGNVLVQSGSFTVGTDADGYDVTFHSDTTGDNMLWDTSEEALVITGTNAQNALHIVDGDFYVQSGSITVGTSGYGDDVTFHSDTAGDNLVWSATNVDLTITGTAGTTALDVAAGNTLLGGDLTIDATDFIVDIDGNITIASQLDTIIYPVGADLLITANSIQTGTWTLGSDGTGYTTTWYSDTAGDHMVWDDANEVLEITGTNAANALHVVDGDVYVQSGSFTLGASDYGDDVTIHGDTAGAAFKWDSSDDAVELDGTANITHEDATYTGALFISAYKIVYTQTTSTVALFTIPAHSYVKSLEVVTTTAFDESGTLTIDVGYSGQLEAFAGDLDIKAVGYVYGDVFTYIGTDSGASALDIVATLADQNNDGGAGAATIYLEWTMVAPRAL